MITDVINTIDIPFLAINTFYSAVFYWLHCMVSAGLANKYDAGSFGLPASHKSIIIIFIYIRAIDLSA